MAVLPAAAAAATGAEPDDSVVGRCMAVLRAMFGHAVAAPRASRVTRWASDPMARGSYTYLKRGSGPSDIDQLRREVGPLFFAGDATSHEAMGLAHGALMSGFDGARRLESFLRPVKRHPDVMAPGAPAPSDDTTCALCHRTTADDPAEQATLGPLTGPFLDVGDDGRNGTAHFYVHEHCAAVCPEVTYDDNTWFNVTKATRRGRKIQCSHRGKRGATIGCLGSGCRRQYHGRCAGLFTGWDFDRTDMGKHFFCQDHRGANGTRSKAPLAAAALSPPRPGDGIVDDSDSATQEGGGGGGACGALKGNHRRHTCAPHLKRPRNSKGDGGDASGSDANINDDSEDDGRSGDGSENEDTSSEIQSLTQNQRQACLSESLAAGVSPLPVASAPVPAPPLPLPPRSSLPVPAPFFVLRHNLLRKVSTTRLRLLSKVPSRFTPPLP